MAGTRGGTVADLGEGESVQNSFCSLALQAGGKDLDAQGPKASVIPDPTNGAEEESGHSQTFR